MLERRAARDARLARDGEIDRLRRCVVLQALAVPLLPATDVHEAACARPRLGLEEQVAAGQPADVSDGRAALDLVVALHVEGEAAAVVAQRHAAALQRIVPRAEDAARRGRVVLVAT